MKGSKLRLKTLVIVIILLKFFANADSAFCPEYCKCDLYEGRNRADCTGKRLINAYVDLSAGVEILDLSYNDIAIIDDKCFQNYHFLINLTITHNDVHTIYLDAFVGLRRLKSIDLAYNRLEYLDERLFESNRHLEALNLEGNKFMILPNRPLLRSTSLQTLNLRDCSIDHISAELLTAMPQLTELNLSQNLMITLSAAPFNAPKRLKLLLLDENAWNCDKVLVTALSIMRHRGVNVSIAECDEAYSEWQQRLPLRGQTHMFERMQLRMTPATTNETNKPTEERSTALNWRNLSDENEYSDDSDNDMVDFASYIKEKQSPESRLSLLGIAVDEKLCEGSPENLCRRYRNCLEQVSHVIKQMHVNDVKDLMYTQNDLNFGFLLGIAVGVTGVVFIITCALCLKNCLEMKKLKKENDLEAIYDTLTPLDNRTPSNAAHYAQPVHSVVPTAPLPPIRRPRRARRPPTRPMEHAIVQRTPGSDSFISRLLGRPARRRYYHVGTTTLIRCLSRTSLFNNNLQRESSRDSTTTPENLTTEAQTLRTERPETPPPNYGDIMNKK